MHRNILKQPLLLKKYSNQLVFDYTEYPTKTFWQDSYGDTEFKEDLHKLIATQNTSSMLYIHTPFCEELCYFCLCSKSITNDYEKVSTYLYRDLSKEIDLYSNEMRSQGKKIKIGQVYFGGGSPTYYHEKDFQFLIEKLRQAFEITTDATVTVEIDPRRVNIEKLKFYSSMGVNRLSFGVQDFDITVQKEINRIQPPELLEGLLTDEIRSLFPTINFDVLIGLPRQTPESMRQTIERIGKIRPTEVQPLYLHYKPGTRSYMTRMTRNVLLPDFFDRKAIYAEVIDGLTASGYLRAGYENFALPNDELSLAMSKQSAYYNSLGTTSGEVKNFVSLGASAHGTFNNTYSQNFYELEQYSEALKNETFPIYRGMRLSQDDAIRHEIIKHFRIYDRLLISSIEKKWNINFNSYFANEIAKLSEFITDGLINLTDSFLEMTPLGREFTPRICEVFDAYANRPLYEESVKKIIFIKQESFSQ